MFLTIEDGRTGLVLPQSPLKQRTEAEAINDVASWNACRGVALGARARLYRDDGTEIEVPEALIPMHHRVTGGGHYAKGR